MTKIKHKISKPESWIEQHPHVVRWAIKKSAVKILDGFEKIHQSCVLITLMIIRHLLVHFKQLVLEQIEKDSGGSKRVVFEISVGLDLNQVSSIFGVPRFS